MKEKLFGIVWVVSVPLVWVLLAVVPACTRDPTVPPPPPPPALCTAWEYKVLYAQPLNNPPREPEGGKGMLATSITPNGDELNKEGKDGWELAGTYLEMETAYASGTDKGVYTPNIRPQRLVMIFKKLSCPK